MTVLVLTIGTHGDVRPHVALARGLSDAGHAVTVGTSPRYRPLVEAQGLAFAPLSDDLVAIAESMAGRGAIEDFGGVVSGFRGLKTVVALGMKSGQVQRDLVRDGWAAARHVRADVIVYHPNVSAAVHYAEKLGVPAVMAPLYPQLLPTTAYPGVGLPQRSLGARYNRLTHRAVLSIVSVVSRRYYGPWRQAHGLSPRPRGLDVVHATDGQHVPVLNGWSRHVAPDPPDWPDAVRTTGYWFLDPADWQPPAALAAFLDAGPPPVYVGFGSMAGRRPERTTAAVLGALHQTGLRAVLASGWGGLRRGDLPASVFLIEQPPHDWLFPRVTAVVHHGGAGTTAAGLRAGRPTVVCPFFGDQPFWGRRVHELGAGPPPIPQKRLTAERLAVALREATENPSVCETADALGAEIRREDGTADAVAHIERLARSSGR